MTPADNVMYFNTDIDIRLCLKNGYTTLKRVWMSCYDEDYIRGKVTKIDLPGTKYRYELAMMYQDPWDQPFRRGSYRIAIKRDPVQRFISAMSYLNNEWYQRQIKTYKLHPFHKENSIKPYIDIEQNYDNVDAILDAFDNQTLRDEHFFSQSYFMGHPNDYDKVYDITEMPELLSWLTKKCKPHVPIEKVWENRTKNTSSRIELTEKQTLRIIRLYAKDYANGWC
jgi:hypothetical protein